MKLYPLLFITIIMMFSCTSGPIVIPEDETPSKIIQSAQEATDANKYRIAIQYYQALLERFGDNSEFYCIANYEIAFIHYKQRRFSEARAGFEHLLNLYNAEGGDALPRRFKVLSEMILANLTERGY